MHNHDRKLTSLEVLRPIALPKPGLVSDDVVSSSRHNFPHDSSRTWRNKLID